MDVNAALHPDDLQVHQDFERKSSGLTHTSQFHSSKNASEPRSQSTSDPFTIGLPGALRSCLTQPALCALLPWLKTLSRFPGYVLFYVHPCIRMYFAHVRRCIWLVYVDVFDDVRRCVSTVYDSRILIRGPPNFRFRDKPTEYKSKYDGVKVGLRIGRTVK